MAERQRPRSVQDLERQKQDIEAWLRTVYPVTDTEIDDAIRRGYDPSHKRDDVGQHQRQRKTHTDPREVGEILEFYRRTPRVLFVGVRKAMLTLPWDERLVLEMAARGLDQTRIAMRLRCTTRTVQRMKQRALEKIALAVFDERGGLQHGI